VGKKEEKKDEAGGIWRGKKKDPITSLVRGEREKPPPWQPARKGKKEKRSRTRSHAPSFTGEKKGKGFAEPAVVKRGKIRIPFGFRFDPL